MAASIAILGAGPSGLTLACLLLKQQIPFVVFERDPDPTTGGQGGTLDIHTETGQLALRECGLYDEFRKLARYDGQAFRAVDKDGKVLVNHLPKQNDDGRPEIDRRQLRELLLSAIPQDTIRWGMKVEAVERNDDGTMTVRFANGDVQSGFNLVVGADGAWSRARRLITPATPIYSGVSYLQMRISPSNPFHQEAAAQSGRGTYFAASEGKAIIAQRMSDDSYNIYAGLRLPENWAKEQGALLSSSQFREELIREQYSGWSKSVTALISKSDEGKVYCWALSSLPIESLSWTSTPGVTLIGDAAHLALANGEGVNCAMFDALQLVQTIENHQTIDEAVRAYETEMLPRGRRHIEDGFGMLELLMRADSPRGLQDMFSQALDS